MANEPTAEEVQEIIDTAAQQEMARIAGVPEPEPVAATTTAQNDEPNKEQPAEKEEQPPVEEPSLADQFNELRNENKQLRKLLDTTNGRLGQEVQFIKRRLDEAKAAPTAPNLDDVFSRLNIEDPAFAELKAEFPELAGHFVTAFSKALTKKQEEQRASDGVKTTPAEKETQRQEAQVTEQQQPANNPALDRMALDTLQTKHPDFLELAHFTADELAPGMLSVKWKDQSFGAWLDTMPSDVREAILIGGSVDTPSAEQILRISDIMTEYKAHQAKTTTKEPEEPEDKQEDKAKPKVDLKRTLLPTSRQSNKVAMTDEEIIEQAKANELKRIANGE